jgi:hypothetical protein
LTKAFDKTLAIVADLEDAMALAKTEMLTSDTQKTKDLQKIVSLLDQASGLVIDAVVVFRKHNTLQ